MQVTVPVGGRVRWLLVGMGTENDMHSPVWHNQASSSLLCTPRCPAHDMHALSSHDSHLFGVRRHGSWLAAVVRIRTRSPCRTSLHFCWSVNMPELCAGGDEADNRIALCI